MVQVAILSSLRSPYIVQFLGASLTQGSAMLLTEFCERGDLYQAIKRDQGTGMLSWYRRSALMPLGILQHFGMRFVITLEGCQLPS